MRRRVTTKSNGPHTIFGLFQMVLLALGLLLVIDAIPGSENSASADTGGRGPNIIFVLADDLAASDLSMLPQLNGMMAKKGTTFENAFATSTICCPSRATILRGQYVHNHKIYTSKPPTGGAQKLRRSGLEKSTVGTWLNRAPSNYKTAYIGKYLNGYRSKQAKHVPPGWNEWFAYIGGYQKGPYKINHDGAIEDYAARQHDTDVLRRQAVRFIKDTNRGKRPFFLVFSTNAPHAPYLVPKRHEGKFHDADLPKPPSFNEEDVKDKPRWVRNQPILSTKKIGFLVERYRGRLRTMLSVQEALGSMVRTLENQGRLDETYIVFTSDHGYHLGQHRLWAGKRSAFEQDTRIPLMIRGPGIPAGKSLDHLTITNDLAPTFADLANAKTPDFVDGRSLVPLLRNDPLPQGDWRRNVMVENFALDPAGHNSFIPSYRALHTSDHVYVRYETGEREFYDLTEDPYQLDNAIDSANSELIEQYAIRLNTLRDCSNRTCRMGENSGR